MPWCKSGPRGWPITEDWLRAHGFKIYAGRADERLPVRRLPVGGEKHGGRSPVEANDDLCIDVAPVGDGQGEWSVWVAQEEPYRAIHVRYMRHTGEIARLYEGLTGRAWPGAL